MRSPFERLQDIYLRVFDSDVLRRIVRNSCYLVSATVISAGMGMLQGAFQFRVLGVAGVIAFVIGSIILMDSQQPGYEVPLSIIAAFTVTSAGLSLFTIGAAVRMRNQEALTGKEAMVGKQAEVLEDFDKQGWVRAFGENWLAESAQPVKKQAIVKIVAVEGLILKVQPEKG